MFEISTDIPHRIANEPRIAKYPFKELGVGHSFLIPASSAREVLSGRALSSAYAKRLGYKFATSMTPDGLRIWRTA